MKQEKNGLYYFLLLLGGLKKYFFLFTSKNMNKLIKIAFGAQVLMASLSIMHNFWIVRLHMNFLSFVLYTSIVIRAFLTWKVFDKTLAKGTRIAAFIAGTIPMVCIILFIIIISTALHH